MLTASIEQLKSTEERLTEVRFTQETSRLNKLDQDFSPFNGKRFQTWLEELNEKVKN